MNVAIYLVICVLVDLAAAEDTYRAAVVQDEIRSDINYIPAIYEAGRKVVDILVLPSADTLNSEDNYDESIKNIAKAARVSRVYVAAHLYEARERVRTSLVFNREGAVVAVYRKPVNSAANHTVNEDVVAFSTDFGVDFTVVMEEDLALQHPALMKNRNLIVTGSWPAEIPFLTASQLGGAWSYVSKCNVLSPAGIHGAPVFNTEHLVIADLNNNGRNGVLPPPVVSPSSRGVPGEDLSQYIIKPVDMEASTAGYTDTVCHHKFCCQFYVKAGYKGSKTSINYGFAAFDGVRHFGRNKYIGTQTCAIFACAGLYKRSCHLGSQNNTDEIFKHISISGNFTHNCVHFPMIVSGDVINTSQYTSDVTNKQTTVSLHDTSVITFGIFGRDFRKDHEAVTQREAFDDSQGLFNENVQEFIDYVWIRLRILIFVVSIYILEMM